jgi:hypothetical protein
MNTPRCSRIVRVFFAAGLLLAILTVPVLAQEYSATLDRGNVVLSKGEHYSGVVNVVNMASEPITVKLSPWDMVREAGETDNYPYTSLEGMEPRSLLPYVTYVHDMVTVPPGKTAAIPFDVDIPEDPSLNGSYWFVMMTEQVTEDEVIFPEEEEEPEAPVIGVQHKLRFALVFMVTIKDSEHVLKAKFSGIKIVKESGIPRVTATLSNQGNVYIKPEPWLEIRDSTGALTHTEDGNRRTVLPESGLDFNFFLKDTLFNPGEYLLLVIADYGKPNLIAAQGRLTITEEDIAAAEEYRAELEALRS